jgi:hypothetical protein
MIVFALSLADTRPCDHSTAEEEPMTTQTIRRSIVTGAAGVSLVVLSLSAAAPADMDLIAARSLTERHVVSDDLAMQITLAVDGLPETVVELDEASRVAVVEITVQPGAMFPWHTHPGPAFATVTQGELVYVFAEDCVERPYAAGTAFLDPGFDNVHTAFNPLDEEKTVVVATFFGVPEEGPLTIPIDGQEAAVLDEQCGMER